MFGHDSEGQMSYSTLLLAGLWRGQALSNCYHQSKADQYALVIFTLQMTFYFLASGELQNMTEEVNRESSSRGKDKKDQIKSCSTNMLKINK